MYHDQLPRSPVVLPRDAQALRALLGRAEPRYPGPRLAPRVLNGTAAHRPVDPPPGVEPRRAAVLALLYPTPTSISVLLIRRPDYDGVHGGQIGLPGGSIEPQDASPLAAALREAREEVGLDPSDLEVWGPLEPIYIHVSNFMVEPFLGWRSGRPQLRPDPAEVAEVLEAPLATLFDPRSLDEEEWTLRGQQVVVPFFRFGPHKVWGATAAILDQLRWRLETSDRRP